MFTDKELKAVVDELYVDDAVDIIEEMPANVVKRILKHTDPETRKDINEILKYPKDSAGSMMTTEYVSLKKDMTVMDAFEKIRQTGKKMNLRRFFVGPVIGAHAGPGTSGVIFVKK